jgi:hypothetical protein
MGIDLSALSFLIYGDFVDTATFWQLYLFSKQTFFASQCACYLGTSHLDVKVPISGTIKSNSRRSVLHPVAESADFPKELLP